MNSNIDLIRESVIRDMSEGLMIIGLDGKIADMNPAASAILKKEAADIVGMPFAAAFFEYEENDDFNQTILDAVYAAGISHKNIVKYFTGSETKYLSVTTSYLLDGEKKIAVIAVVSDISELNELRDAVKAMDKIRALNEKLEIRNKLLNETFGRFLSDEIVKGLLDTPDGLAMGGKKRELTIMMSDLRGFTAMSEKMNAQDLISMLNHYLGEMTEVIQKNSGTIIEFIGDGIMAAFGAPVESAISAQQAVTAAVEMQSRMDGINLWNEQNGYPQLDMGIGINTGDMIVGNIGSEKRTKYGVCGSNVNLCGRIESYTTGGQIIISPETKAQINLPLKIAEEFTVKPKGVDKPITLSRITGIGELVYEPATEPLEELSEPENVTFYTLDGKHTSDKPQNGCFIAKSTKEALLKTETPLSVYDNISLELGTKIFAKVVENENGVYKIRFTSK